MTQFKKKSNNPKNKTAEQNPSNASVQKPLAVKKKRPTLENRVGRLQQKDLDNILHGWKNYLPSYYKTGGPPSGGLSDINLVAQVFEKVDWDGDVVELIEGIRPSVLHEAIFLAHKAVHVELSCIDLIAKGRQTWAIVDAYQASMFSIASISAFLGISVDRHGNDFILMDTWSAPPPSGKKNKSKINLGPDEYCQFLRFGELGHYQKWAILQRLVRTLKSESPLIKLLSSAISGIKDKEFALHRNKVHYNTECWLSDDLLDNGVDNIILPATSSQELLQAILEQTPLGTIYLMTLLNEVICMFISTIASKIPNSTISSDLNHIERRRSKISNIVSFDMRTLYTQAPV